MSTTDLFKQVLFNDGEALSYSDFNNSQRFAASAFLDQFLGSMIPNLGLTVSTRDPEFGAQNAASGGFDWGAVVTSRAFCLHPGQAFLRPGSSTNKVQIAAGTLLQLIGTVDGNDAKFIPFTFTGAEEFTIAAGGTTNPRVDLLQMKLEYITNSQETRDIENGVTRVKSSDLVYKARRVQCTLSVKSSSMAASPTVPEPDSGYCAIGTVLVGGTYGTGSQVLFGQSAGTADASVYDQRFPFKVKAYWVDPTEFKRTTAWSLADSDSTVQASNGTNNLWIACPAGLGRIMGIGMWHSTATLSNVHVEQATALISSGGDERTTLTPAAGTGGQLDIYLFTDFENTPLDSGKIVMTQSATSKIGTPLWTNGARSPTEDGRLQSAGSRDSKRAVIQVQNTANTTKIGHVVFYVAEGL